MALVIYLSDLNRVKICVLAVAFGLGVVAMFVVPASVSVRGRSFVADLNSPLELKATDSVYATNIVPG